jgi:hypothetical protein
VLHIIASIDYGKTAGEISFGLFIGRVFSVEEGMAVKVVPFSFGWKSYAS